MSPIGLYFSAGLALLFVVMWDYNLLPRTAKRFTRQPQDSASQFSRIALGIRNLGVMALLAFFLWPLVLLLEILGRGKS